MQIDFELLAQNVYNMNQLTAGSLWKPVAPSLADQYRPIPDETVWYAVANVVRRLDEDEVQKLAIYEPVRHDLDMFERLFWIIVPLRTRLQISHLQLTACIALVQIMLLQVPAPHGTRV